MYGIDENQCSSELSPFDVRNHFSSLAMSMLYSAADLECDIGPNQLAETAGMQVKKYSDALANVMLF